MKKSGMSLKHKLRVVGVAFRSLSPGQKFSIILLLVILVTWPLVIFIIMR